MFILTNLYTSPCRSKGGKSRSSGGSQGKGNSGPGKHGKSDKGDKSDKEKSRHSRGVTSFHRRGSTVDQMLTSEMEYMYHRMPPPQANFKAPPPGDGSHPQVGQTAGASTPFVDATADSPHSAAPSPLAAPQIPTSVSHGNGDPTMPTLSPHPPPKIQEKEPGGADPAEGVTSNGLGHLPAPAQPGPEGGLLVIA